jgi:AcrR family transcriptional regulator
MSTRMHNRRRQIEDAASTLFSGRGYAATSMRDIAGVLDLQGGSLYAHVASKEELLWSIVDDAAGRFHAAVGPLADGPGGAAERLRAMVAAHVGVLADGLERASVYLYEWTFLGPERRERIAHSRDAYQAMFERVIAEGQASGELDQAPDPKLAATFVLSAVNTLPRWFRVDGPLSLQQVAKQYADLFLHGLTPEPPGPPAGATPTPPPSQRRTS